jgi:hypothetical protein
MRVAAIECLGTTGDDLVCLLEQAKAKAKDVRAAALRALVGASSYTADMLSIVKQAIAGPDIELFGNRLAKSMSPDITSHVLAESRQQLQSLLKEKDPKKQAPGVSRLQYLLMNLDGRTDAEAEAFLLECFQAAPSLAKVKSTPSGQDINELVAHLLCRGTPTMRKTLVMKHAELTGGMLPPALRAAREIMTPAAFYQEFSPMLADLSSKRGKKGREAERAAALAAALLPGYVGGYSPWFVYMPDDREDAEHADDKLQELDPRWLDAAVEAEAIDLVYTLARPGHTGVNQYLSSKLAATKAADAHPLLQTMVRIKHPDAARAVVGAIKAQAKSPHYGYMGYWYSQLITGLPKAALPEIEALLPTLPDKMVDQLMEAVIELKNRSE